MLASLPPREWPAPGCGGSCSLGHGKRRCHGVEPQEPSLAASSMGVHGKCTYCYEPLRFGVAGCHCETDMRGECDEEGSHKGNLSCPSGEKYKLISSQGEGWRRQHTHVYTWAHTDPRTIHTHMLVLAHTHT